MEFAFSADYQTTGETHQGAIGTGGSGVVSLMGSGGRQGSIDVDVLAVAKDGGLVIRSNEWLRAQPRPSQAITCAVYPDGRVICPQNLPVTDAETTLMAYLGRNFFDPSLLDAKGHWQRSFADKEVSDVSDFTVVGSSDANPLNVKMHSEVKSLTGVGPSWHDDSTFTYDPALNVPISIHDVAIQTAQGSSMTKAVMEFQLAKDSFAKP